MKILFFTCLLFANISFADSTSDIIGIYTGAVQSTSVSLNISSLASAIPGEEPGLTGIFIVAKASVFLTNVFYDPSNQTLNALGSGNVQGTPIRITLSCTRNIDTSLDCSWLTKTGSVHQVHLLHH